MRKAIGTDRRRRPERTLDVLREVNPHVIALQECDRRFGQRQGVIAPHMLDDTPWKAVDFRVRPGSMGWHGNAILVRKDVEVVDQQIIHLPALEPRGAVMADLRADGVMWRVVGMHLDLSGLWRRRQAHAILSHLNTTSRELPTVMMGDLNDWSAGSGCLRDFGREFAFAETGRSFHARRPVARLDRIMVSQGLTILDSGVNDSATARIASDHLPIWADIMRA